MQADFVAVTEMAGDAVSNEQIRRLCQRYYWAADFANGRDVIELACGTGSGIGYLSGVARSMVAGDLTMDMLVKARAHYRDRAALVRLDATALPFADRSADVVILFEALYYLPSPEKFAAECRRVLRPDGVLLIATANKDLPDFNPSDYSNRYFNAPELAALLQPLGFEVRCFGGTPVGESGPVQNLLRWAKRIAVRFDLIPRTMGGKKLLKRIVFGKLAPLPAEIAAPQANCEILSPIPLDRPDGLHKVLFCAARLAA